MWARVVLLCLGAAGCEQALGIHDPRPLGGVDGGHDGMMMVMPDTGPPPPNGCAAVPAWGNPTNYSVDHGLSIAVGDVTGDGLLDVVVVTMTDVEVFPGGAGGRLGGAHALASTPIVATNAAVADFNHDGHDDVVTWRTGGPTTISLYEQAAGGSFDASPIDVTASGTPTDAEVGDLNGDGVPDLLVQYGTSLEWFAGGAAGLTGPNTIPFTSVVTRVIDVDQDGLSDLVTFDSATNKVSIAYNSASTPGSFSPPQALGSAMPRGVAFGHFSAGSGMDAVLLDMPDTGALYAQAPPRTFMLKTAAAVEMLGMANGAGQGIDLNGDGRDDIAIGSVLAVQCSAPAAPGSFFPAKSGDPVLRTPNAMSAAVLVDLDANGKADFLTFDAMPSTLLEVYIQ